MANQTLQVGQRECKTQDRIVLVFRDRLGYDYLGSWEKRDDNKNIEEKYLRAYLLKAKKYNDKIIDKAISKLKKVASNQTSSLYNLNKEVYELLRYGVKVREQLGFRHQTVELIDWRNWKNNHFAIAEEVTIKGKRTKRPDVVLYVNGIALGVIELKRSTVSVSEGIRQNIGNQKSAFIQNFFGTIQLIMAGNDTEGLKYGTTQTTEDYYLAWSNRDPDFTNEPNRLDRHIMQICQKSRLLEIIHGFIIFDSGIKKICRHNQYFSVKSAQEYIRRHEGGIIWHTQGSGKSLIMVWLAKWIHENITNARVLLLTDRIELDEQIEGVFNGVGEKIHRARNGKDLINQLNTSEKWLIGSLVHKFSRFSNNSQNIDSYLKDIKDSLPSDFSAKGDIFVFVDECHRSHSGFLHKEMKKLLPNATFIGFTGTPLLKFEKRNSIAVWGKYIHEYKYDEAVADKVVLDLRYEARRVDQNITSQDKIDEWFEERTKGLTDVAKAELKKRWGTMKTLLSSESRLSKVVFDIMDDFYKKPRLASGRGNAMLVASSIYEACQYYRVFQSQGFSKCAVITSYEPNALSTESPEYAIYEEMLNKHRPLEKKSGESDTDAFERLIKKQFIKEPGQMQLLIVVDKLLTGFDTPPTTYLYIDKNMQDHGLFQAICRVNRLNGNDKDYGYIIDYRDLFKKVETAITDYTSEAFAGFDQEDVLGLLKDRLEESKKDLNEALETIRALCEPVQPPKESAEYIRYFCGDVENPYALKENETKRIQLYKSVSRLLRVYADIANEMEEAGYSEDQRQIIKRKVEYYEKVRTEIKLASGDYIDLKKHEPVMRTLIDRYISASESERLTTFDDKPLVELMAEKGVDAINNLPSTIRRSKEAIAETIENNVRKLITDEMPTNPKYYQRMSELLGELVRRRKQEDLEYREYLEKIIALSKQVKNPSESQSYPDKINTRGKQAIYDNFGKDQVMAELIHDSIMASRRADWRGNIMKERTIKQEIQKNAPTLTGQKLKDLLEIIKNQNEY